VSTGSNVSVITKTVEKSINTPKHTIKRKVETADVQLKSAKIPVSSKQTENSEKIESVWDFPPSSYAEQCSDIVEDEDVDIESVCSDMSETISQVSIDTESKLSPSDFKQLLAELKGSKKHIEKCLEYTDDLKSLCQEFIDLRRNPDSSPQLKTRLNKLIKKNQAYLKNHG